jgi:tetratricopeptide (TPR) repeat protein
MASVLFLAALLLGCVSSQRDRAIAVEYFDLGNAYLDLGQYDKAITEFQSALRLDPGFVKADYNLALTYVRSKRFDDAVAILKRLLVSDPRNTQVLSALGWALHSAGRDEEALKQYDAVIAESPADLNALYNSGIILWKLNRPREALDRFTSLLTRSPEDTDGLYAAGSVLLSLDEPAESGDMLSRYLDKKPDDTEAWFMVAAGAERQKKYSRALEAYGKAATLDPAHGDAWFGEARLLLTVIEDPQRGLDSLQKALDAGFKDQKAVNALLDSPGLLDRDKVESALKGKGLLPIPAPADSAAAGPSQNQGPEGGPPAPAGGTPPATPPATK